MGDRSCLRRWLKLFVMDAPANNVPVGTRALCNWNGNRWAPIVDTSVKSDSDPLRRFLADCTVADGVTGVRSADIYAAFCDWCKASGEREWTAKGLSKAMMAHGFQKCFIDGVCWLGVRLKPGLVKDPAQLGEVEQ